MECLHSTVEYRNWGWNAITIGAIVTVFFVAIEVRYLWRQCAQLYRRTWSKPEDVSLSTGWLLVFAATFVAFFIYGLEQRSVTIMINGLLALLKLPILYWLYRYKGWSWPEIDLAAVLLCFLWAMVTSAYKDYFFMAFSLAAAGSIALQPIEMWRKRSNEGVDMGLIWVYLLASCAWVVYGYAIDDWVLKISTPLGVVLFGLTVVVWHRNRWLHRIV